MNPKRWHQVDDLFQTCLELEGEPRTAFLDAACADDTRLRDEVQALLASDAERWNFIESPALELAAPLLANDPPQFASGEHIAHYQIVELIGRGGMGEVYLARDEILNRPIALKFLPAEATADKDRLRRFQREAQAASALNHPNILTIHQLGDVDGQQFIATELIEGQTLRQRLSGGPLPLREALEIIIQVAGALTAAHKAGIVHRDIKPENIMLRPDGYVKVLDFGLAKLAEKYDLPTHLAGMERSDVSSGLVMGTIRYMSPEQARGLPVDARSDIFSLGVVLSELVRGRPPFENSDPAKLVESILHHDPPSLRGCLVPVPEKLEAIITRSLSKATTDRYQQAGDLLVDLRILKEELERDVRQDASRTVEQERLSQTRATAGLSTSNASSTLDYITDEVKRPRIAIALAVVLAVLSLVGYIPYKFLQRAGAGSNSVGSLGQTSTWTTKAPISSPRSLAELAVLNGVLYVAGGWNVCTPFANLESYDPVTDTWTQRAPMPTARGYHAVGALNGLLYAVGGSVDCGVDIASVEAYDPVANTWSPKASLPTTRNSHVMAVANGKLYVIGGDSNRTGNYGLNTEYDSQTDRWIDRAPLPTPRHSAAAAVVNDIIYVIGGGGNSVPLATVEAYDPATNSWRSRKPMLIARTNFAATVINGVIYVLGGLGNRTEVEAYDPATDTWEVVGQLPTRRSHFRAAVFDESIYIPGGSDGVNYLSSVIAFTPELTSKSSSAPCPTSHTTAKTPMPTARNSMAVGEIDGIIYVAGGFQNKSGQLAVNEAYDPVDDNWTAKTPMPTARDTRGTNNAVVDGKLYVIGGNARGQCTSVNEAYDPATDTWMTRAPMPTPRCNLAVVTFNGLIYAIGGTNTSGSLKYATVEIYNPPTDTWTTGAPMPTARQHLAAVGLNGMLYAVGGWNPVLTASGNLNVVEAYDPTSRTWTTKASMPTQRSALAAGVVSGLLVVVGGQKDQTPVATVEAYDPASDTWTTLATMPAARTFLAAVTLNNTLYAFGGSSPSFPDATTVNEALNVWPCSVKD